MQVVSVLNQTAMSLACRANTLERCADMRSEVAFPQVATPPCFSLLFSVSCQSELPLVGGEPVCYSHLILHDMEKVSRNAIFVLFKLHGGWLPSFRLVPCCFWEAVNAVTIARYLSHLSVISCFAVIIALLVVDIKYQNERFSLLYTLPVWWLNINRVYFNITLFVWYRHFIAASVRYSK